MTAPRFKRSLSLLLSLIMAWSLAYTSLAANNTAPASSAVAVTNTPNQPASLLILTPDGAPDKIYGNRNIDWQSIGFDSDTIPLSDYEKMVMTYRSKAKLTLQERAVLRCLDYHLIDETYDPWREMTVSEFLSMLCRTFHQDQYDYLIRTGNDDVTVTRMVGRSNNFLPDITAWQEDPDNYILNETIAINIVQKLLAYTGHDIVDVLGIVPRKVYLGQCCEIITKLIDIINPPEPVDKLVYGNVPVIPLIIQPVLNQRDDYHDFRGTSWTILNNNHNKTGYLSNGKVINNENIWELLTLAEQAFPENTLWTSHTDYSAAPGLAKTANNNYGTPSKIMESLYLTRYNVSPKTACGGFASFLSDLLFGATANPARATDATRLHPGDIQVELNLDAILAMQFNTVTHTVMISIADNRNKLVNFTEGNKRMRVAWNSWRQPDSPMHSSVEPESLLHEGEFVYYTRWPAQ